MEQIKAKYKSHFKDRIFLISFISSFFFLVVALIINFYAGMYATESASGSVTDIILSNTRVYDLDGIFVYGSIVFFFFIVFVCTIKPHRTPFTVKSIALFIIIRSAFITLTHIGPFPSQIVIHSDILSKLTFGGDLFFSGHTGLPFLLALIFWKDKIIRNIFILFSLTFAVVVLLSHMHYTIDVLSAFFITYTIFHIAELFFRKDKLIWD
jgi:hypothetical protein